MNISAMKIGEVSDILGVTRETVRNWVNHEYLSEFFSDGAKRADGRAQAEFNASDLDVLNSINAMRSGNATWRTIRESLLSGWRQAEYPPRAAAVAPGNMLTTNELAARALATATERDNALDVVKQKDAEIEKLNRTIDDLRQQLITLEREKAAAMARLELERELARVQAELDFRRAGWLPPLGE